MNPFHLAIATDNLSKSRDFYNKTLGCEIGREDKLWVDFNFFSHQLSIHLKPDEITPPATNNVDGKNIPVKHFGVILKWDEWHALKTRLETAGQNFIVKPYIRFKGAPGEQATMFITDPANNYLEFKSFKDFSNIFNKGE